MSSTTYLFNIENINEALVKETIKEVCVALERCRGNYTKTYSSAIFNSRRLQKY